MTDRLRVGDRAPSFALSDQSGDQVGLDDFRGRRVIVYFYPAAFTPGCTAEACDFRDNLASLTATGYAVLGVSPDDPGALEGFAAENQLGFPLLSDPDGAVARAWGAWAPAQAQAGPGGGLQRSTVVVDDDGRVVLAEYDVAARGHVVALREQLLSL